MQKLQGRFLSPLVTKDSIRLRSSVSITIKDDDCCVDQVEGLGSFLELEILVNTLEEKENALQSIEALLLDMGSSLRETTRKSYLAMLLSKGSPD